MFYPQLESARKTRIRNRTSPMKPEKVGQRTIVANMLSNMSNNEDNDDDDNSTHT